MKNCILTLLIGLSLLSVASASEIEQYKKTTGSIEEYEVHENDTLMLIAFKIYGEYRKWKDLAKLNPHLEDVSYDLKNVKKIKFEVPTKFFKWEPLGEPYLVKKEDTLGTISDEVYHTPKRWGEIYQNNRPLIKDPNLIFAGFTLYYIPDPIISSK